MPIIANTTSANTFSAVRAQLNSVTKRMNQFAINESAIYANTITANSTLRISGGLIANGSLGTSNYVLRTNGTSVYWAPGGGSTAQYLQVANAVVTYQTKAVERAALANTNAYIATRASWTELKATNTAIRALDTAKLAVSNAVATYATKASPTTSGLLAHTGRATISTNLAVTGNTTISGLVANGSLGTSNKFLKTNGTSVFWGEGTPVVLTKKNVSALVESDQVVTNVQAYAYANTVVDNSLLTNYAPKNNPQFTGTVDIAQANFKNQTLTDGATISWDASSGTIATVTLGGNRTLSNPSNLKVGTYMLIIKQDATGSRLITWGTSYKFPAGVKPTLTTTANAIDIISFYSDGTNMFGVYAPDMK